MDIKDRETESKRVPLVRRFKNLLGAGLHMLLAALILESLTLLVRPWISYPVSLAYGSQILLTILCVIPLLLSVIWFQSSLNLIKVHLLNEKKELITCGPFAYVRHPLYSSLVIMIPPLVIVWLSDLLFLVPWVLMLIIAHPLVRLEERGLIEQFGEDYETYREFVPALLPYKGAGGKRYRRERS